jgi:hypothetical protein
MSTSSAWAGDADTTTAVAGGLRRLRRQETLSLWPSSSVPPRSSRACPRFRGGAGSACQPRGGLRARWRACWQTSVAYPDSQRHSWDEPLVPVTGRVSEVGVVVVGRTDVAEVERDVVVVDADGAHSHVRRSARDDEIAERP